MRTRNIGILFRLDKEEARQLEVLVEKSGLSKEGFIRMALLGYQLHEKPGEEFYDVMREMSAIGNNLNQLARRANAYGVIDAKAYAKEAKRLREFQLEVKEKYLLPQKGTEAWQ